MSPDKLPNDILWHQSGVNPKGEPFVQLLRGDQIVGQMSPEEAREHAHAMLEAAEAAEQDAFLMHFAREIVGASQEDAAGLLMRFREFRARTTGKSQGPARPRDWVMPPEGKRPDYGEFWKK